MRAKPFAHNDIDRLGIANASSDECNGFAFHCVLKPVADKSRNIAPDMHRHFSGLPQQLHRPLHDLATGFFVFNHFNERHQVRRIPEMRADNPLPMLEMPANLG